MIKLSGHFDINYVSALPILKGLLSVRLFIYGYDTVCGV